MTDEEMEYYHDRGLMPNWAYYQQCGIKPTSSLWKRTGPIQYGYSNRDYQIEELFYKELDKRIEQAVEKALENLLTDKKIDLNIQL